MPQLSAEFVLFAAVAVLVFQRCPYAARGPCLALLNTAFLAYLDPVALLVLGGATAGVYAAVRAWPARAGLPVVMLLIGGFLLIRLGARLGSWAVPIGLGFALLRLLPYVFDRRQHPTHGALQLYNHVLFFPSVLVGPVARFEDFLTWDRRNRWDEAATAEGLRRVVYGYAKVVILASWVVAGLYTSWAAPFQSRALDAIGYGLHLYLAFSGYSDIAIGLGLLLGYVLPENFSWPLLAPNIGVFWQRWHISVSEWCRAYVFTPVLAYTRRPALGIVASMLVLGLWHEFGIPYLIWGFYHGLGILGWRTWRRWKGETPPRWPRLATALGVVATWLFVFSGFAITAELRRIWP